MSNRILKFVRFRKKTSLTLQNSVQGQLQFSQRTALDRYPEVFKFVSDLVLENTNVVPRILSFGCSTGEEPLTFRTKYFQNAEIYGVDISSDALELARRKSIKSKAYIKFCTPVEMPELGEFDAIFAMSVLCRWPATKDKTEISEIFPFRDFEHGLSEIVDRVKVGGYLTIYNSNYRFEDSMFFADFQKVEFNPPGQFVTMFDKKGRRLPNPSSSVIFYRFQSTVSLETNARGGKQE